MSGQKIIDGLKDAIDGNVACVHLGTGSESATGPGHCSTPSPARELSDGPARKDLNNLSPAALRAALRGGTAEWGRRASIVEHVGYVEPQDARGPNYRKCPCGCGKKAKHRAMFNGVCMYEGCELSAHRFVKTGRYRAHPKRAAVTPRD